MDWRWSGVERREAGKEAPPWPTSIGQHMRERERERFKRKEIGGRGSIVVGGSGGEHTGYVDLLLFRIFHGFLGSTSLSLCVCVSKRATAYVCVCLKVYISVVCECFLDLSKYENFIWIYWFKNVHTKRKHVLKLELYNFYKSSFRSYFP